MPGRPSLSHFPSGKSSCLRPLSAAGMRGSLPRMVLQQKSVPDAHLYACLHHFCIMSAQVCTRYAQSLHFYQPGDFPRKKPGWFADFVQKTCTLCTLCADFVYTTCILIFESVHLAHFAHLAQVCKSAKIWHAHFAHLFYSVQSLHNISTPLGKT